MDSVNYHEKIDEALVEIQKVVVGQEHMINRLLIGLFTQGHVLLEGVPGLAKTLTINTLANVLNLGFNRIQFTPDLLPADLVGTMIYNQKTATFEVKKGAVFANIVLADEVNRSPAKVQSALLECMAEKQVTIGDTTFPLDRPFLVLATQNPVDQEGTYPLPEAQVDRFMLKVNIEYPTQEEELEIMRRMSNMNYKAEVNTILTKEDIFAIRGEINAITVSEAVENYIVSLIMASRNPSEYNLKEGMYLQYGCSPRATIGLNLAARATAYLKGRDYVLPEDVKEIAHDVLSHRVLLNYEAEADGVTQKDIVDALLKTVPVN